MNSLYKKFVLAVALILSISLLIAFTFSNVIYYTHTKTSINDEMVSTATTIANDLEELHHNAETLHAYLTSISNLGYQLMLVSSESTKTFGEPFKNDELPLAISEPILTNQVVYNGIRDYQSPLLIMGHFSNNALNTVGVPVRVDGTTYALFARQENQLIFSNIHAILVGFVATVTIISLASVLLMTRYLVQPLVSLKNAAHAISNENYSYTLRINRKDEIGELAKSFNHMQNQLLHNDEARKAFVTNISHDFQSPLLNIEGYSSLLANQETLTEEQREFLGIVREESRRLSSLTKQLLLLTSLDQRDFPSRFETVRVDEQLRSIIRYNQWKLEDKHIEVSYSFIPASIKMDEELMENVWTNLLNNAIKYNRDFGTIFLRTHVHQDELEVTIRDSGIGIKEEAIPLLYNRFYREERAQNVGGTGLGLSIVKEIVDLHKGRMTVKSEENKGTEIKVFLPLDVTTVVTDEKSTR
ncbi:HAMP domain-containing sensor histidine kinase [Shouchella miscanthi]|uniref:Heme sensor protein HssS n=1 Tax=Shouchella miscanthi TaxID=2598861 RepID=A0ABU6NKY5_9BACI|nr:HAMP domain-containing sensor histidine kinase [Shouchella miscanthi]